MSPGSSVSRLCACAFSVLALLALTTLKANAIDPSVVIDSVTPTHGTPNDSVSIQVTFNFSESHYRGEWTLWEDKSGDAVAFADSLATGRANGAGTYEHTSGSKQYSGTAGIYYMGGFPVTKQVVTSTTKSIDVHLMP